MLLEAPWRPDWGGAMLLRRGEETTRVEVPSADMFRLELENLADAVAGEARPLLGRADALGQARALDALYRSAAEGRAVTL
jgi:predicted dehydrogenase